MVFGSVLTGLLAWLTRPTFNPPPLAGGPGVELMLDAAATSLEQGGPGALKQFATTLAQRQPDLHLHAIDQNNQDLMGSSVDAATLSEARAMHGEEKGFHRTVEAHDTDGRTYLIYLEHPWPENHAEPHPPGPPDGWHPDDWHPDHPDHKGPAPRLPWFVFVAGLLASLAGSALLAWYLAKPIRHLRQAFRTLAQGRLDTRVQKLMGSRRDELADLGRDFDRMSQQLEALMQTQQRLLHDVSHELRSPLARLQAAISLLRQNPERLDRTLERADLEIHRLDSLVGELLTLARIENEPRHYMMNTPIDLAELLLAIVDDARFEAAPQDKSITLQSLPQASLKGNPELLHRALENVIRNAIRHTEAGTSIEISLTRTDTTFCVEIADRGPGVASIEIEQIFEPFYRGSYASTKGSGLGLTIARRAVVAHGGSITAENRAGGGLTVSILLPA